MGPMGLMGRMGRMGYSFSAVPLVPLVVPLVPLVPGECPIAIALFCFRWQSPIGFFGVNYTYV